LFGSNGGMLRFIIGNTKYLKGPRGLGGPGGSKPPPLGFSDYLTKILSTSLGIYMHIDKLCFPWSIGFGPHTNNNIG
jgi:hypothetical protein